jgi:phenylalanyl-tRNA synthetase beta chain
LGLLSNREIPNAKEISRFPSVRRDLAFLVPEAVTWAELRACVAEAAGEMLVNLLVFDVYGGGNVEKGYKSIAIGLILQNVSSTLTDEAVEPVITSVISRLEDRLDAQLRG